MKKAIFNWSGGKDSSMSLYHLLQKPTYNIQCLLTSISEKYERISMHGVRLALLKTQAQSIGIPLHILRVPETPTMEEYDRLMAETLNGFKEKDIHHVVFGDIFLEDLKEYRQARLREIEMEAVFPIWKKPTTELVHNFIELGFKAVTTCVNEKCLDKSFVGRTINQDFLNDLPSDVDPCGENGEFHSFVFDGPIFKHPIKFEQGDIVHRQYKTDTDDSTSYDNGFWYCDLIPL